MSIRTIVVDDEAIARRGVCQRLRTEHDIEIVAECGDGAAAIAAILELRPDLVFLDLQMPQFGGFEVIENVGLARMPAIIFITAYDQYAARAFDVQALDYVLKPIDGGRFARALQRARQRLLDPAEQLNQNLAELLKQLERTAAHRWTTRLAIRSGGRVVLVDVSVIDYCEAAGNYVEVHAAGRMHMLRETLVSLQARLDPDKFVRISRSVLVNVARVHELHPMPNGDFVAMLADGTQVAGSRRCREVLDALLR